MKKNVFVQICKYTMWMMEIPYEHVWALLKSESPPDEYCSDVYTLLKICE